MPGTTTSSRGRVPVAWRQLSAEPAKLVVSLTAVAADITSQHAAGILGAPPTTERKWVDAGRIPHVLTRVGHRRFDRRVLDAVRRPGNAPHEDERT